MKKIELPKLRRMLECDGLELRKADDGKTRVRFSASSEARIDRFGFTEVLSHAKGAIRLDRAAGGAMPFLFNHNSDHPIGVVESAAVEGSRLIVEAAFFNTDKGREASQMMADGLRNVSIGYRIYEATEDRKTETLTATDWEPYEVSMVTTPADISVGIGRAEGETREVRIIESIGVNRREGANVTTKAKAKAAGANQAAGDELERTDDVGGEGELEGELELRDLSAVDREKARKLAIRNLSKVNRIPEDQERFWITSGASLEVVADDLVGIMAERGETRPESVTELGLSRGEQQRFSLARAIEAAASGSWRKAPFEMECSRELYKRLGRTPEQNRFLVPFDVQRRDPVSNLDTVRALMSALGRRDLTAGGSALVGTELMGFIELLRNRSVAFRMGAIRLSGLSQNVAIPRQLTSASAGWLATEATQATESAATFNQLTLTPKTAAAYTEISRQLILQSQPAAEQIVANDLAAAAALAVDSGVLAGDGTGGAPTGIMAAAGIGSVTGTTLGYAGLLEFQTDLAAANVEPVSGGYVTTPAVAALLSTRVKFSGTATPLWDGNIWNANVCGFAGMSSNQMAAGTMVFADWSKVVVGEWGVLEIETNPYANFQAGIIGVRAMYSVDVGLRYAGAVSVANTIT